jgi:hypothetical protein
MKNSLAIQWVGIQTSILLLIGALGGCSQGMELGQSRQAAGSRNGDEAVGSP